VRHLFSATPIKKWARAHSREQHYHRGQPVSKVGDFRACYRGDSYF
jgi:hypothetical protein